MKVSVPKRKQRWNGCIPPPPKPRLKKGDRCGRWTIQKIAFTDKSQRRWYTAKCDCGTVRNIIGGSLTTGRSKSCGCWQKENPNKIHGLYKTTEYRIWLSAKHRAKRQKIPFAITPYDIRIPEVCPIFGTPISVNARGKGPSNNSPSLDKLDPKLGYTPQNIWIISNRANRLKSNLSLSDLMLLISKIENRLLDNPENPSKDNSTQ